MQKHLQKLVCLLTKNDLEALLQHYLDSSENENLAQLGFMFQQAQLKLSSYDFYQQLATSFIESKGFSTVLINKVNTNDTLSFFTPALQIVDNFNKTDQKQRNVLHYLFTNNQIPEANNQPPFNYLRSMMLFGSNKTLRDAICHRDDKNLTPVEAYLFANKNLSPLSDHELTALLALIEIENKQQVVDQTNYSLIIQAVNAICKVQAHSPAHELQRIILIGTYYSIPVKQACQDISNLLR